MGSLNIQKEQEEFEKELNDQEKLEFQQKLKEQEKEKDGFELKKMYIYLYSNTKIPEDFKNDICSSQSLKNIKINNELEVIDVTNKERNNWIFYLIDEGNEKKLKSISQNFKNKDSVFICFSKDLNSPEIEQILTTFSKVFLKY